jgi:GAF domain-containing protein
MRLGLEERVAERTRALEINAEVSRRLSTILDQQQLLLTVVEEIQRAYGYYHVHIYLLDERKEYLVMTSGTGEAGLAMLRLGHKIKIGRGLVGRAAERQQVVLVPDSAHDPAWLPNPLLPDTKAEVAVPIILGEQVLGVLDVQQNIIGGLGLQDVQILQSIANQVAVAVQNARVYTLSQQQAEREMLVNVIGRRIQSAQTIDDVLKTAIQELWHSMGAQQASIQIKAPVDEGATRVKPVR